VSLFLPPTTAMRASKHVPAAGASGGKLLTCCTYPETKDLSRLGSQQRCLSNALRPWVSSQGVAGTDVRSA